MENKIVSIDTSILIDYFRKKEKDKTQFVSLTNKFEKFCIASIVEFEIYVGATNMQLEFWERLLKNITVLPFDSNAAHAAVSILNQLKQERKTIDKADLFIASIAVANNLPLATLNQKHFASINNLELLSDTIN